LKAIYAGIAASAEAYFHHQKSPGEPPKTDLPAKLSGVFRAERLVNLIHRRQSDADYHHHHNLRIHYRFEDSMLDFKFEFGTMEWSGFAGENALKGSIPYTEHLNPKAFIETRPVFLPTRELLSLYPGFVSLYETTHLPFEETWRDTALLLGAPLAKGEREKRIATLLEPIEAAMGGRLVLEDSGRFYLITEGLGRIEMHLLAEGFRKLGMLARLIATGALLDRGYLFWDEPEANLNPKLIKKLAKLILQLSAEGIQIFIATHSLFLLRELHILQKREFQDLDTRGFGLHMQEDGTVSVQQGNSMDEVGSITVLDEDLQQSERYIDTEMRVPNQEAGNSSSKVQAHANAAG
ncbi:MAG: ATP-binding protein, partial [Cytophagaceae bacterium]